MLEMMKGYLQLAAGLGEMSRRKAMDAARELVEGSPVAALRPGPGVGAEAIAGQVSALADELLAIGRQNRALLAALVRTETEAVLASVGGRGQRDGADHGAGRGAEHRGLGRLDEQLRLLRGRVDDLERQLRESARGSGASPTTRGATPRAVRTSATTAKTAARAAATTTSRAAGTSRTTAKTAKSATTAAVRKASTARKASTGTARKAGTARATGPARAAGTATAKTASRTSSRGAGRGDGPRSPRRTAAGS